MFTSADRSYFGWKNPNQKIGKNVRFFITGGAVRFITTKIKNATLNAAHLGRSQKVTCLKCFEKLKVMNYRPKVMESPTKNPWSDRPTLKACL